MLCVICQDADKRDLFILQPCSINTNNASHILCGACAIKMFSTFKTTAAGDVQCPVCRASVTALQPAHEHKQNTAFEQYFRTQLISAGIDPGSFAVVFGQYYPVAVLEAATAKEAQWALQSCIISGGGTVYNPSRDYWITNTLMADMRETGYHLSHPTDIKSCFARSILLRSGEGGSAYVFCRVARPYTAPFWVCVYMWPTHATTTPESVGMFRRTFTRAIAHESGSTCYQDFTDDIYSEDMTGILQEIFVHTKADMSPLKNIIQP